MPIRLGDHSMRRKDASISKAASWRFVFSAAANAPNNDALSPTLSISRVDIMRQRVKNVMFMLSKFRTNTYKVCTYIQQQWITPTQLCIILNSIPTISLLFLLPMFSGEPGTRLQFGRAGKMFCFGVMSLPGLA